MSSLRRPIITPQIYVGVLALWFGGQLISNIFPHGFSCGTPFLSMGISLFSLNDRINGRNSFLTSRLYFLGQLKNMILQLCGKMGLQTRNYILPAFPAALWRESSAAVTKTCSSLIYLVLSGAYTSVSVVVMVTVLVFG